jgi:pyruvate formate lyase activating enzyme
MANGKSGSVAEIKKSSLENGPGVRTVIYLQSGAGEKGKHKSRKKKLIYKEELCSNCFACIDVCKREAQFITKDGEHALNYDLCTDCAKCVKECGTNALVMERSAYKVKDIIKLALQEKSSYDERGGGITLAGEEPLKQFEFAYNIIKKAGKNGLHTAIETKGMIKSSRIKKAAKSADLFLFNYAPGNTGKKAKAGSIDKKIIKNLKAVAEKEKDVFFRCQLAHGINDMEENLISIAEVCLAYSCIKKIEFVPYVVTSDKKKNTPQPAVTASAEDKKRWMLKLAEFGVHESLFKAN